MGGRLVHCVLTNNLLPNTGSGGGAVGSLLEDCTLVGNRAPYNGGGASDSILSRCTLTSNTATESGGGVYYSTLDTCTLTGNSARNGGGADYGTLNNCVMKSNSATWGGGGANGSKLNNCTLYGNSAAGNGGGAAYSRLNNCVVYYNTSPSGSNWLAANILLDHCCTAPLPPGDANFTNAPLFVNAVGGNLRLQANSPCINAGRNAYVSSAFDLDGLPRIVAGTVDVGAYEYQSPASTISYAWLQQYGFPTDGSADAADPDFDGMSNWSEWIAGTDPTIATSRLRMLSASQTASGVTVSWTSVTNRTYALERAVDLGFSPAFTLVQSNLPGQVGTTAFTDPNPTGDAMRFYRVRVSQ